MKKEEENNPKPTAQKKSWIKKILKGVLYTVVGFIVFNILLYLLLSIPFIQQKVVDFAIDKVKTIVKTEVRIDHVNISLFNNVDLQGVYIEDQAKDTLIYAGNLGVNISPWELLKNKLQINAIELDDFTVNVSQKTADDDFNFQFLIDAFAGDTTATDTTSSSMVIKISDITLKKGKLKYDILSDTITPHLFNPSHIHIYDLNAQIKLPSIDMEALNASIVSLSFKEQSGLEIKNLAAKATSDKQSIYLKDAKLELPASTLEIPEALYNLKTGEFAIHTNPATLSPKDLMPFMTDLKHLQHDITLQTSISGKLPSLAIDSLIIHYGDGTAIKAKGSISDYEHYDKANINLSIDQFLITPADVTDFAKLGDSTFVAPDILKTLGDLRLMGSLTGSLNDFNLDMDAWAKQGALKLVAKGSVDTTFQNFDVDARLQTQNFNIGSLLENPQLGRASANLNLRASQSPRNSLSADIKGAVSSIEYNKHTLQNIPFTAYYNSAKMGAWIKADLSIGKLEAKADMTQGKVPVIDMNVGVEKLRMDYFIDSLGWYKPELSLQMNGNITGLDMNNIHADVVINNLQFSRDSLIFKPGVIALKAGANSATDKYINLTSNQLNASILGDYNFTQLPDQFNNMMHDYLPGLFPKKSRKPRNPKYNKFKFSLTVNNTENLGRVFDLPADIIEPIIISGTVDTETQRINAIGHIPLIMYSDLKISETQINLNNNDSIIDFSVFSNLADKAGDISVNLNTAIQSDTINTLLNVARDSSALAIDGSLNALVNLKYGAKGDLISNLKFLPTFINIGKLNLSFMPANIHNENERTTISNFGFMVGRGRSFSHFFGLNGAISEQKEDTLKVSFSRANVGEILRAFDINNVSTVIDGQVKLTNLMDRPEMYTGNLEFSNIVLFNDTLGTLKVQSKWGNSEDAIVFRAILDNEKTQSKVSGYVYPHLDSLNLKVNLDRLALNWVQPFMADVLNHVSGSISTGLAVTGKLSAPDVRGWLGVNDAYLGIDYTNVTYHISDTIDITPNRIGFNNLVVEDSYKNKASVNALVTHNNFEDMKYNINMRLNNLLVLNTASRTDSLFYGKVFASGNVNINGSDDLIDMKMTLRNGKNSYLNVQIPQTSDAADYQSIVYINTPKQSEGIETPKEPEEPLPLRLSVDLTVSPDLALGVIINPLTGDALQAKGAGLIKFNYDMPSESMTAFGNYTLSDGSVKLKLQNISTLNLKIKEGSELFFEGDPLKTRFDITAYKRVKADLATLDPSFGNEQGRSLKANVDCVLEISGDIDKMNLGYNVTLPDAEDDVQQRFKSLISTDEQRVKQFASLLVMGSFYSGGSMAGGNITNGMLTSIASDALSLGMNMLFGNMLGDKWQIGTNVSSNDGTLSDMDMTVNVSRKFFDDKLEFNSNLGYRTDQSSADNSFIGDFDVAYALTRAWKLKVFNKTNDRYYKQAPMTQGIGIVYTKEAKSIKELFQFFRKKRVRNRPPVNQTEGAK